MPGKYRHRPTVVEAIQYTGANLGALHTWLDVNIPGRYCFNTDRSHLIIETLEGDSRDCSIGDDFDGYWIVKGIKGEFYPVDPAVFADAYEEDDDGVRFDVMGLRTPAGAPYIGRHEYTHPVHLSRLADEQPEAV